MLNVYSEPEDAQDQDIAPLYNFHDLVYDEAPTTDDVIEEENDGTIIEEGTNEVVVSESVENVQYPEYLDNEWIPPTDAEDSWYREKYQAIHSMLSSEDLAMKVVEANRERLLAQEKDIENFRELYIAHKEGKSDFLRQNFPDELAKIGINPILKEEEIDGMIEQELQKEFGENYAEIFDQKQVIKPTSISAKIFNKSQELHRYYEQENERRQQLIQGYQPQQIEQQVPLDFDKVYNEEFKELPREQYDSLVNKLKEDYPSWTLKQLLRVVTYEDDLAKAREEGRREALDKATKEFRTVGNAKPVRREQASTDDDDLNFNAKVYGSDWSDIMRGMIHN